jgi:hypothetical protein
VRREARCALREHEAKPAVVFAQARLRRVQTFKSSQNGGSSIWLYATLPSRSVRLTELNRDSRNALTRVSHDW